MQNDQPLFALDGTVLAQNGRGLYCEVLSHVTHEERVSR